MQGVKWSILTKSTVYHGRESLIDISKKPNRSYTGHTKLSKNSSLKTEADFNASSPSIGGS